MVKIQRYLYDITIEKNNFAFEVKVTLGLENTCLHDYMAEMGSNGLLLQIGLRSKDTLRV